MDFLNFITEVGFPIAAACLGTKWFWSTRTRKYY